MKPKHIGIVACLALMTAAPAVAQQSFFTDSVLLAANPCFNASGAQPPAAVIHNAHNMKTSFNASTRRASRWLATTVAALLCCTASAQETWNLGTGGSWNTAAN